MGFFEVLTNLRTIFKNIAFCKEDIENYRPDTLIFIDYSGFNLRIAEWAKKEKYSTQYYISPQVWASRAGRVKKIKRDIDAMYVILPFEEDFYKTHGYAVHFVGHPLIDAISQYGPRPLSDFKKTHGLDAHKPIIALLPGSRAQEVDKMLRLMLTMVPHFSEYQFVIAGAPSLSNGFYTGYTGTADVYFVKNKTYDLLSHAHAALVTSGTATLETALFKVPQVVCYKANWVSYQIARRIITLKFISLVNLIMDEEVVPELIQDKLTTENLEKQLRPLLLGPQREAQLAAYTTLESKLGGEGASEKVATMIYKSISWPGSARTNHGHEIDSL